MLKKVLSLLLVCAMCIGFAVPVSAESIYDTAQPIDLGDTITDIVNSDLFYKFEMPEKGTLSLNYMLDMRMHYLYLFDENGTQMKFTTCNAITGIAHDSYHSEYMCGEWNGNTERFKAECTYRLNKGTYYLKISPYFSAGTRKLILTAKFVEPQTPKVNPIGINMTKGQKLKLSASLTLPGTVKWSSSNTAVATVTKSGNVTAKKKGSVYITAKCGDSKQRIKITVK